MTGMTGHDPGISGHVRPESLVTLLRNTQYGIKFHGKIIKEVELTLGQTLGLSEIKEHVIPKPSVNTPKDETDYDILATKDQLIRVFGQCAGVNEKWFDKSAPWIEAGKKVAGKPGRSNTPAWYSVPEFIAYLLNPRKRRPDAKMVTPKTVWWVFEHSELSHIYKRIQHQDPRELN